MLLGVAEYSCNQINNYTSIYWRGLGTTNDYTYSAIIFIDEDFTRSTYLFHAHQIMSSCLN